MPPRHDKPLIRSGNWIVNDLLSFDRLQARPELIPLLKRFHKAFNQAFKGESLFIVLSGSQASFFVATSMLNDLPHIKDYLVRADADITLVVSPKILNTPALLAELKALIHSVFLYKNRYLDLSFVNANEEPYFQIKGEIEVAAAVFPIDITINAGMHKEPLHNWDFRIVINPKGRLELYLPNFDGAYIGREYGQMVINHVVFQLGWDGTVYVNYEALFETPHLNPDSKAIAIISTLTYLMRTGVKYLHYGVSPSIHMLYFFKALNNLSVFAFGPIPNVPRNEKTAGISVLSSLSTRLVEYTKGDNAMFARALSVFLNRVEAIGYSSTDAQMIADLSGDVSFESEGVDSAYSSQSSLTSSSPICISAPPSPDKPVRSASMPT